MRIVDLTQPFPASVYNPPGFPPVRMDALSDDPGEPLRDTRVSFVVHVGTHIDAPRHLRERDQDVAGMALDRLIGPAVAWALPCESARAITAGELEAAEPPPRPGDQVYVWTGWDRHFGDPATYARHPHLDAGAADWLVEHGVALLAIDTPTPDLAVGEREPSFDYPVHRRLLSSDIPIVENMANLEAVAGRRFTGYVCPIPFVGSDGAPARVFADVEPDARAPRA
jgi:arylformamidase